MAKNFDQKLKEKLKQNMEFWDEEIDDINRNEIIDRAYKVDKDLIGILIDDKEIRETFFDKIKEYWVFNVNKFVDYIENIKVLSNSYTKFKNIVGLNVNGKSLNERGEVSLVWPFKDCVLEGGMTKEDQKRNEIFFNQILAKDEIDRLFDAKVLTNFKKYTAKGEEKVKDFNRDEKGTIKDNLIIKGNNLLALHSLKKEFAGKVKLIYIDPPYNKDADSFYNDNFKRSSWLTFMKNRLEISKDLLREDGCLFVQIDNKQQGYLKILLDEIFGEENFVTNITCKVKSPSGIAAGSQAIFDVSEYILAYSKNSSLFNYNSIKVDNSIIDEDETTTTNAYKDLIKTRDISKKKFIKKIGDIDLYKLDEKDYEIITIPKKERTKEYYYNNWENIGRTVDISGGKDIKVLDEIKKLEDPNGFYIYSYIASQGKEKGKLKTSFCYKKGRLIYLKDYSRKDINDKAIIKQETITNIFSDNLWHGIAKEGEVKLNNGKKPEKLIQTILDLGTDEKDIIMDYHLGSGTTCAVAHKMGRQYIGIEQLDYGENDSVVRLKNVVEGDPSGISKAVNWKGGGEFTYCELLKYNEEAIDKIQDAKDTKTLLKIWDEMCDKYFLRYDVDIKKFNDNKKDFEKLTLKQQKDTLVEMLNKNQLYVNLSEIEDSQFKVSKEDKELNKKFYGGK